jgi:UPF0755 protein
MTKIFIRLLFILPILAVIGYFGFNMYTSFYTPLDSGKKSFKFSVVSGDTVRDVATKLEAGKVISTSNAIVFHNQFEPIENLQVGEFNLVLPSSPKEILSQIAKRNSEIKEEKRIAGSRKSVQITFREGDTADQFIEKLVKNNLGTEKAVTEYIQKPGKFTTNQYPFLPKALTCEYGNLANCQKYYLEGYLYPDTYSFFVDSTLEEVFTKVLNNFNEKVYKKVDKSVTPDQFTKAIIMGSVIEKESGRPITGVNNSNIAELNGERKNIAGVFYNRIKDEGKWGSDPTVTYGSGKRLCQSTLKVPDCVYLNSPQANNLYNTYEHPGYPIGAITSPQWDCILAALEPVKSDYYFFVSDGIGKKYFAVTDSQHQKNIQTAQQVNATRVTE